MLSSKYHENIQTYGDTNEKIKMNDAFELQNLKISTFFCFKSIEIITSQHYYPFFQKKKEKIV
jgi:hypothetical protein